jgi:hypothetical protein
MIYLVNYGGKKYQVELRDGRMLNLGVGVACLLFIFVNLIWRNWIFLIVDSLLVLWNFKVALKITEVKKK